jgi:hypothetical protein
VAPPSVVALVWALGVETLSPMVTSVTAPASQVSPGCLAVEAVANVTALTLWVETQSRG